MAEFAPIDEEQPTDYAGAATAALQSAMDTAVPGAKSIVAKGAAALGPLLGREHTEQEYAKDIDEMVAKHPEAKLLGMPAGVVLQSLIAGPAGAALGVGAKGAAAIAGITGAIEAGEFQAGDALHQMQLDATPQTIENVAQALDFGEMLKSGAIAAGTMGVFNASGKVVEKLAEGASKHAGSISKYATKLAQSGLGAAGGSVFGPMGAKVGAALAPTIEMPALENAARRVVDIGTRLAKKSSDFIAEHVDNFMQGSAVTGAQFARKDLDQEYEEKTALLKAAEADPQGFATRLRQDLDWLPQPVADGVAAKTMEHVGHLQNAIPKNPMPPSYSSADWQPSDHAKRQWLAAYDAVKHPINGFLYGTPQTRQLAELAHPETTKEIRRQLSDRLSDEQVPYRTRLLISRVLGAPGVPSQDPILGAKLQATYQQQAQQNNPQGTEGGGSARQQRALQQKEKQAKADFTYGQSLMNVDE